jgi:hypothetical protein
MFPLALDCRQGYLLRASWCVEGWGLDEIFTWWLWFGFAMFLKKRLWLQTMNQPWKRTLFWIISFDCGPRLCTFSSIFKHKLFKCIKLLDIACVQILEYVEDEHCFFVVIFKKISWKITSLAIWINIYMRSCTMICIIEKVPFKEAIKY